MPKNIKTKEKVFEKKTKKGSVGKAADRAKIISAKTKDGAVEVKNKVQENTTADEQSPEQYAADLITLTISMRLKQVRAILQSTGKQFLRCMRSRLQPRPKMHTKS